MKPLLLPSPSTPRPAPPHPSPHGGNGDLCYGVSGGTAMRGEDQGRQGLKMRLKS